jgi:glyoxylase-like metal-dependent hydrolase (beta-lactamase superfamily II)
VQFLTLAPDDVRYAVAEPVVPGVRRVLAENPSKFTYYGTGTYLVGADDEVVVVDPGPSLDAHRDALEQALSGATVRAILITHCHSDHSPLAAWLQDATGAPTIAWGPHGDEAWDIGGDLPELAVTTDEQAPEGSVASKVEESIDRDFRPDVACADGDTVAAGAGWEIRAVHTPGHTSNHTCFALAADGRRILFTGDHVMGWSTTVVSPPDGDMAAYLRSLRKVGGSAYDLGIPTHGPPIDHFPAFVHDLVVHRLQREAQVLAGVRDGLVTVPQLVLSLYADVRRELHQPAARSVLAHLLKLVEDGSVACAGSGRPRLDSMFHAV